MFKSKSIKIKKLKTKIKQSALVWLFLITLIICDCDNIIVSKNQLIESDSKFGRGILSDALIMAFLQCLRYRI